MAAPAPAQFARAPSSSSASLLRKSFTSFFSSLPALLLASLLLFTLRSALVAGTLRLSLLPDTDPLLRSLLARFSPHSSSSSSTSPSSSPTPRFLHLTPTVPLPDDFFPSSPSLPRFPSNSSFPSPITLSLSPESSTGARISFRPRPPVEPPSRIFFSLPDSEVPSHENPDRATKGFSLGRYGIELVYLLSLLSSAHTVAILGFIVCYAAVLGVVFYSVAWSLLSRPIIPLTDALLSGVRLGVRRLAGFVFLKWAIRDALVQLLCIWFFANMEDQNKLFKLFIKVKLMPFSVTMLSGNEDPELPGFLFAWELLDILVSMLLFFVPWVVAVDWNVGRRGQEVLKEGVFLATLVPGPVVWIRCLEMVVGGRLGLLLLSAFGGRRFAMWAQAMAEVYFMVLWLILYVEARRKDCELGGRRFGREELEKCIERL
ncbi:hypothetical protein AXF42_Ash013210 [Apostasia shenzhenica]|uniref:Transmembrane protein n=1 Tax=Apostasia shenzhenica TaxID=1088818 RepID=A0A2I0BBF2_9ASPA|nr:hypothetical protein AXF42_Ash013210 [Apostasia shenzhenica]